MWKKVRNHFVTGIVALLPFFLTLILIRYLIRLVDSSVVDPVFQILPFEFDATSKVIVTKLLIAALVVLFLTFIGWAAQKFIFKRLFAGLEKVLDNIPFFNRIYGSIREVAQAFFGDKTGVFKRVVFVEYPRKGVYSLGFVTQEKRWEIHEKTGKEIMNVFLPHPPNPATGYFIFAPKEELIESDLTVEEGIKLVISAGAAVPAIRQKK